MLTFKLVFELINSILFDGFPSGSSINHHQEKFYLIGDDATHILVLDKNYSPIDSINLFAYAEKRIAKPDKIDLEASVIVPVNGVDHLIAFGSASRENREQAAIVGLSPGHHNIRMVNTGEFIRRIRERGISEVNIEGVCIVQHNLVLGNRGNLTARKNQLIVTSPDFWKSQAAAKFSLIELVLTETTSEPLGLSELCYVASHDLLLITLTSEATTNAYDDGEINDSYIAWITEAGGKLQGKSVTPDGLVNLSDVSAAFGKHKIEGICVSAVHGDTLTLHLVSDNDSGESRLFNLSATVKKK